MILAPLTELPKEEREAFVQSLEKRRVDHPFDTALCDMLNAHRAKLDKVVSEWYGESQLNGHNTSGCNCLVCIALRDLIRRLKEESNA